MTSSLVGFEVQDRAGRLLLDRPEAGNQVNVEMMRDLINVLEKSRTEDIDVLVVSGAGTDFCLGRQQGEKVEGMTKRDGLSMILETNRLLAGFPGVTIAAVQGRALGFGTGLAVQCDLTVVADTAQLGFTEIHHGFAPAVVMTYLERYVSRKAALDLVMTGRCLGAEEALRMGLVTSVVPGDLLEATVTATVETLLGFDAAALRDCKGVLREMESLSASEREVLALDTLAP